MAAEPSVPEIGLTVEERIESVLALTGRLARLEDLLRTAKIRRGATDTEVCVATLDQADFDEILAACTTPITPAWMS
jgi:hypothetical protein